MEKFKQKKWEFLTICIISLVLFSCNQVTPSHTTEITQTDTSNSVENKTTNTETEEKDTIFSIFTSDMDLNQFYAAQQLLLSRGGNFVTRSKENGKDEHGRNQYIDVFCYKMLFNGKPYYFDVDHGDPKYSNEEESETYIDIISLHNTTTKKDNLLKLVLDLYSKKYSNYKRNVRTEEFYGILKDFVFAEKKDNVPLQCLSVIETYKWPSNPNLEIVYRTEHHMNEIFQRPGNFYTYEIIIMYYSNRYLNALKESVKNKELERKKQKAKDKKNESSLINEI